MMFFFLMFFLVSIFSIEVEEEEDWMPRITQGELLSMAFPEMKESFLLQENIGGKGRPISKEEMKQYTKLLYEQGMEIIDSFHSPIETEKSLLLKKERGAEEDNCVYVPMVLDITFLTSGAGYLSAVQYINEYTDILGQTILLCPVIYPSTDFTEVRPYVDRVSNITNNVSFVAMIGPEQSLVAEFALIPAMLAEMPSVSGVASSVNLESVSLYDSFYHCIGPEVEEGYAFAYSLDYYDMRDICIVVQINGQTGASSVNIASALARKAVELNITIHRVDYVDLTIFDPNDTTLWDNIRATGVRVIVGITSSFSQPLFQSAADHDFTGFPYIWYISRFATLGVCCSLENGGWVFNNTRLTQFNNTQLISHPYAANTSLGLLAYELVDNMTSFGAGTSFRQFDAVIAFANALGIVIQNLEKELGRPVQANEIGEEQRPELLKGMADLVFNGSQGNDLLMDSVTHSRVPEKWIELIIQPTGEDGSFRLPITGEYVAGKGYTHYNPKYYWTEGYGQTGHPDVEPVVPRVLYDCSNSSSLLDKKGIIFPDDLSNKHVDLILETYHCDEIIDCNNWSDEDSSCSTSMRTLEIVMGVLAGIVILIVLLSSTLFALLRNWGRVRARGTSFLALNSLGTLVGLISIFSLFGRASDDKCLAFPWLVNIGASLVISGLVAKQYRVFKIFLSKKFESVIVTNTDLLMFVCFLMIPEVILLIVMSTVDTPEGGYETIDGKVHYVCSVDHPTVWLSLFVIYKFILLALSSILSIRTRKIPTAYSEGQVIGYALYNATFSIAVFVPIVASQWTSEPELAYIILFIGILWWFGSTYIILCGPLFYGVFVDRNMEPTQRKKLPSVQSVSASFS